MWLFTRHGFYSAVIKPDDETNNMVTLRARVKQDLNALREHYMPNLGEIIAGAGNDYPYRARIGREEFAEGMRRVAMDLNYGDFKSTIFAQQGPHRARVYGKLWRDLIELEDIQPVDAQPPDDTRMAWKLAKTVQAFRNRFQVWPSVVAMPRGNYDLLLLDIGQLWHKPMMDKLAFIPAPEGVRAEDEKGRAVDWTPEFLRTVDHAEAFAWMFS